MKSIVENQMKKLSNLTLISGGWNINSIYPESILSRAQSMLAETGMSPDTASSVITGSTLVGLAVGLYLGTSMARNLSFVLKT